MSEGFVSTRLISLSLIANIFPPIDATLAELVRSRKLKVELPPIWAKDEMAIIPERKVMRKGRCR